MQSLSNLLMTRLFFGIMRTLLSRNPVLSSGERVRGLKCIRSMSENNQPVECFWYILYHYIFFGSDVIVIIDPSLR